MSRRPSSDRRPLAGIKPKPDLASSAAPSQRMLRVGEMIRHTMAELLQRGTVQDDVLDRTVLTVPEVRMSPDLKLATVYIMP